MGREEELAARLGALDEREQKLREEVAQRLAADHRRELESKEQAIQEARGELAETQKSLRLAIEQAGAAEKQAERDRQLADKSAQALTACEGELKDAAEEKRKLSQANTSVTEELARVNRCIEEGFALIVEAGKEASKRVGQLSLGTAAPVLEDSCRSLPAVAEFIRKVAADVQTFKRGIVTQLANDKNSACKQTAALVVAAYKDANPGAVVPDFLSVTPSSRSLRAAGALATALAQKKFPPR